MEVSISTGDAAAAAADERRGAGGDDDEEEEEGDSDSDSDDGFTVKKLLREYNATVRVRGRTGVHAVFAR